MSEPIADLSRSLDEAAALILSSSYVVVLAGASPLEASHNEEQTARHQVDPREPLDVEEMVRQRVNRHHSKRRRQVCAGEYDRCPDAVQPAAVATQREDRGDRPAVSWLYTVEHANQHGRREDRCRFIHPKECPYPPISPVAS